MIAISYVAKNNQREFVLSPLPPPPLPRSPTSLRGNKKNILFSFFVEVIKHCNVNRSSHCLIVMMTLPCATFLRPHGSSFDTRCYAKGSHPPGEAGLGGGGVGTPYNGLYGEAPPERGIFFRLEVYKRVGISRAEV